MKKNKKLKDLKTSVIQFRSHDDTPTIRRRHSVLTFEGEMLDAEILDLTSRISNARKRRKKIEVVLEGLEEVMEKR